MSSTPDPSMWQLLFEQTPPALRWLLGLLTLGLFWLAMWVYRWQQHGVHKRMDRLEDRMEERFNQIDARLIELARR